MLVNIPNLDSPNSPVLFSPVPLQEQRGKLWNRGPSLIDSAHSVHGTAVCHILRQWSSCLTLFIHGPIMIDVVYPWINHLCHCLFMDQSQLTLFIHGPIIFYIVPSWINCLLESAWTLISLLHYTLVGLLKKRGSNVFPTSFFLFRLLIFLLLFSHHAPPPSPPPHPSPLYPPPLSPFPPLVIFLMSQIR